MLVLIFLFAYVKEFYKIENTYSLYKIALQIVWSWIESFLRGD